LPQIFQRDSETITASDRIPVLPLRDVVIFPYVVIPLLVGRPASLAAIESALAEDKLILLVAQRDGEKQEPAAADLHRTGVIGRVGSLLGDAGINIAGYHQSRLDAGGDALAVVKVDARVDPSIVDALGALPEVHSVRQVRLDRG